MARKSGFCATGTHNRCLFLSVNGVRAATRYVLCTCDCHDGDTHRLEAVTAVMGHWNQEHPTSPASAEVIRYVDSVNATISAARGNQEDDSYPGEAEDDE